MAAAEGLQPRVNVVPVAVMTGATVSSVQEMVRETASAALPHASLAVQVRVWVRVHPVTLTVPVEATGVTGPHASVAVAEPKAESMAAAEGLQPRAEVRR